MKVCKYYETRLLTFCAHAQEGYCSRHVSVSVCLRAIRSEGHFPAESVHAHYSIKGHEYPRRGFCTLVHSLFIF